MSRTFIRGQKAKLADLSIADSCRIGVTTAGTGLAFDIACMGLDANDKLSDEAYMIFYNQPTSPCGGMRLTSPAAGENQSFEIDLSRLPSKIRKIVVTATVDGPGTMASLSTGSFTLSASNHEYARFAFNGSDFSLERAIIVAELYYKDGWRISAVAQGFNGGLDALIRYFGGEVAEDSPAPLTAFGQTLLPSPSSSATGFNSSSSPSSSSSATGFNSVSSPSPSSSATGSNSRPAPAPETSTSRTSASAANDQRMISLEKRLEKEAPRLISLHKTASIVLEKKRLTDVRARVVLVLDCSGSMSPQYQRGHVQAVLDRIVTLALRFDDDGELEVWFFADRCKQFQNVTLENVNGYVSRVPGGFFEIVKGLGIGNNEPKVLQALLDGWNLIDPKAPIYVVFLSDGGIYRDAEIEKIITNAARFPVFWQFVGLGGSKYGVLQRLDNLPGRVVDNASFFHVDDLARIDDAELYERLLNEFPIWLEEVRRQGILH